jgi:hypothetical protein
VTEADWLTWARDSRCAEASRTQLPSFVSVSIVTIDWAITATLQYIGYNTQSNRRKACHYPQWRRAKWKFKGNSDRHYIRGGGGKSVMEVPRQCPLVLLVKVGWREEKVRRSEVEKAEWFCDCPAGVYKTCTEVYYLFKFLNSTTVWCAYIDRTRTDGLIENPLSK